MKTASVVDLKAHFGRYLGLVGRGETIVVTSHRHPVACLVRPASGAEEAAIIRPEWPVEDVNGLTPVRLRKPVDGLRDLLSDRDRR